MRIRSLFAALLFAASAAVLVPAQSPTQVHDASALRPPAGARVAIIEFSDMECPDCGRANPLLKEAVAKYHIPWIRHDFPLPYHAWSFDGAVYAHWFDQKSKALGDEYRDQLFANQANLGNNPALFRTFTQRFAQQHGIALPFAVDPQGHLAAMVKADSSLAQRIGVEHTPTIWIVTAGSRGAPFVEVVDRSRLFQMIDQALVDTAAHKPATKTIKKPAK